VITSTTGEGHEEYYKMHWSAARVSWAISQETTLMQPVKMSSSVSPVLPVTPEPLVQQIPLPTEPKLVGAIPGSRTIPTQGAQMGAKGVPTEMGVGSSTPTGGIPSVWTGAKGVR